MKALKKQHIKVETGDELKKETHDIVWAARSANMEEVKAALADEPHCINEQDSFNKMTALHWAGANRDLELAEYLFAWSEHKVDPWIKDKWDRMAVDLALETGNQTLIQLFHEKMFPEDYQYDFDPLDPPKGIAPINIGPKPF
jgi:hypothetical protein